MDVSPTLISNVTGGVLDLVTVLQSRPLDEVCPIACLDRLVLIGCQDKQVINKVLHLALGVKMEGYKEFLELWITETEGGEVLVRGANRTSKSWCK